MTVRNGELVSEYIESLTGSLPSEAVQPNGVDLSIDTLYRIEGTPRLTNGDEYHKGNRVEVNVIEDDDGAYYQLSNDEAYIAVYGENIQIPHNHIGLVFPRSRLMRCGVTVETAVWDSGYEGRGEGGLNSSRPVRIETDTRVAQMVFIETDELDRHYDGSHQSERI